MIKLPRRNSHSYKKKTDYSGLLKELQKEKTAKVANEPDAISKYRKRILEDTSVQYVYSERNHIIHQKHCSYVKSIRDTDLFYSERYLPEYKQCHKCANRSYILSGAKDPEHISQYIQWFNTLHVPSQLLREMYVKHNMQTSLSNNALTIWNRDDTWKIIILEDDTNSKKSVRLMHNNYHLSETGHRIFDHGFHVQSNYTSKTTFEIALRNIEEYEFDVHKTHELLAKNARTTKKAMKNPEKVSIWKRIKQFFHKETDSDNFTIVIDHFRIVSKHGYPKNGDRCMYIWENPFTKERRWQTGVYNAQKKNFTVEYDGKLFTTAQHKVIAWKRIDHKLPV